MDEVVVNGTRYVPAETTGPARIGVGITTHDRPDILKRALAAWDKHLPDGAELVIVDDASDKPVDGANHRFETNVGIARAKNKCLELLADRGVTEFFLFDDDAWPTADDWWRPYVGSREPHAMYMWGDGAVYTDDHVTAYVRPFGVMLYAHRQVLDAVGGMDPAFGLWGYEHESWSDRIHNAGLTTARYQDVAGRHAGAIHACDEHGKIASSVPEQVRTHACNPQLAEATRDAATYISYREHVPTTPERVALSVLVPSVHTRRATTAPKLTDALFTQWEALTPADQARVEVLVLTDTKRIPLGTKRNAMVDQAAGTYVAFVDDDDRIEPDYLTALLDAIDTHHPDVVTFNVSVTVDGGRPRVARYSIQYEADRDIASGYQRLPNHLCAVRRDLVARNPFPAVRYGEDSEYARRLRPLLLTEHVIDRVLYHYDFTTDGTETQLVQRYRGQIIRASRPPVVDVVIMSHARDETLAAMTQHAIDTARAGAGDEPVNVVVIEQASGQRYRGAITMHEPGEFAYNRFANTAAATGSAPWIVVANNDLEFHPGWLTALLAAKHAVVSPANPGDRRQAAVTRNEVGTTNGRHFSGWCFMIKRSLWSQLGGLDEDFRFWCADDAVIEQAKAAGIKPMLVPTAKVTHLTSRTGGDTMPDELTWGQVALFEAKYGVKKFENDKRYIAWKRSHQATQTALHVA